MPLKLSILINKLGTGVSSQSVLSLSAGFRITVEQAVLKFYQLGQFHCCWRAQRVSRVSLPSLAAEKAPVCSALGVFVRVAAHCAQIN